MVTDIHIVNMGENNIKVMRIDQIMHCSILPMGIVFPAWQQRFVNEFWTHSADIGEGWNVTGIFLNLIKQCFRMAGSITMNIHTIADPQAQ